VIWRLYLLSGSVMGRAVLGVSETAR